MWLTMLHCSVVTAEAMEASTIAWMDAMMSGLGSIGGAGRLVSEGVEGTWAWVARDASDSSILGCLEDLCGHRVILTLSTADMRGWRQCSPGKVGSVDELPIRRLLEGCWCSLLTACFLVVSARTQPHSHSR